MFTCFLNSGAFQNFQYSDLRNSLQVLSTDLYCDLSKMSMRDSLFSLSSSYFKFLQTNKNHFRKWSNLYVNFCFLFHVLIVRDCLPHRSKVLTFQEKSFFYRNFKSLTIVAVKHVSRFKSMESLFQ